MSKKNANEIKTGNMIKYNGDLCQVMTTDHVMPGKGGAFIQIEARNTKDQSKRYIRLRSAETVECPFVEELHYQYMYNTEDTIICMNMDNFTETEFSTDLLGEKIKLLQDGTNLKVVKCEDTIISVSLPKQITVIVESTDSSLKNQTVTSSYKNAVIEGGVNIQVPQFIKREDRIVISTEDLKYIERAK